MPPTTPPAIAPVDDPELLAALVLPTAAALDTDRIEDERAATEDDDAEERDETLEEAAAAELVATGPSIPASVFKTRKREASLTKHIKCDAVQSQVGTRARTGIRHHNSMTNRCQIVDCKDFYASWSV